MQTAMSPAATMPCHHHPSTTHVTYRILTRLLTLPLPTSFRHFPMSSNVFRLFHPFYLFPTLFRHFRCFHSFYLFQTLFWHFRCLPMLTCHRTPIRCREHTQKPKQNPRMCLRPFATESRWVWRVLTPKTKTRSWASRRSGGILVSERVEKSWGDLGRFDLSRKLLATGSDQRETMGDGEPRFVTSLTR